MTSFLSLPHNELPSCRYCIYRDRDAERGFCIRHAPQPLVHVQTDTEDDDRIEYTSWPLANIACGDGVFPVGEPPMQDLHSYSMVISRLIKQSNDEAAKGSDSAIKEPNNEERIANLLKTLESKVPVSTPKQLPRGRRPSIRPEIKRRMEQLLTQGCTPGAVHVALQREFEDVSFSRSTVHYWQRKLYREGKLNA